MRNTERKFTRREIVSAFGATALVYGESALIGRDLAKQMAEKPLSFKLNFPDLTGKSFPEEGNFVTDQDTKGKDRVFCASTVRLTCQKENMSPAYGHGSIVSVNGEYHVYTLEHVVDVVNNDKSFLSIPGVGKSYIQPERIIKTKDVTGDVEQAAYYILGPDLQRLIGEAVKATKLLPLRQYYGLPVKNEEVLVPSEDKGEYQRYKFVGFNREQNLIFLESPNSVIGENCQGDSGSPVLRIMRDSQGTEFLTGEMYGVLQGSSELYPKFPHRACATYFSARPNN